MNFFKKYFISAINVDNFYKILNLKDRGYIYSIILGILISLIATFCMLFTLKPKITKYIENTPEFKIEDSKINIVDEKNEYNNKYLNFEKYLIAIYPNLTNEKYLEIKDSIRNANMKDKEKILLKEKEANNKEKNNIAENENENIQKYIEKEAKENNLEEENVKEELQRIQNCPVLILKDSIYLRESRERYIPLSYIFSSDRVYEKGEILENIQNNFIKVLYPAFIFSVFIIVMLLMLLLKLLGSIFLSINIIFRGKVIFLNPYLRMKLQNYALSGPITIGLILFSLKLFGIIGGIDILLVIIIIYFVYLEIISRIIEGCAKTIIKKQINENKKNETFDSYEETLRNIEEKAKNRSEKLKELKEKQERKNKEEQKEKLEVKTESEIETKDKLTDNKEVKENKEGKEKLSSEISQ